MVMTTMASKSVGNEMSTSAPRMSSRSVQPPTQAESAPSGTPPGVIAKLNTTINDILKEEVVRERLTKAGVVVKGSTPEAFGKFMEGELERWNKVREAANIPQQ